MPARPSFPEVPEGLAEVVGDALRALGKHSFVLAIHDPSFPSTPGEDLGRGTPYSEGGKQFLAFVRSLGFTGVQLGPQGLTSRKNPSPYDATLFSRNPQGIGFAELTEDPWRLLRADELASAAARYGDSDGSRARHQVAWDAASELLDTAWERLRADAPAVLRSSFREFRTQAAGWLERDGLFEVLARTHGTSRWWEWPEADRRLPAEHGSRHWRARLDQHQDALGRYAFGQWLVHHQHAALRERLSDWHLTLLGDVQVGLSRRDAWAWQELVLPGWRLGAPPSGTNPRGQPWGFQLLDPRQYRRSDGSTGPALEAFLARMRKMLTEYDGLRLDHPHGLVDPWVYLADSPDLHEAVQQGARLFSSPDHPELGDLAIATRQQLDPTRRPFDDARVQFLEEDQVSRYGVLFDLIAEVAAEHDRNMDDFLCEVLSTCPYPLARVLARHQLGRFRVTQKARLDDSSNGYRSENAQPEDWIMAGNHDTPPLRLVVERWRAGAEVRARAAYLAERLAPASDRESFAGRLVRDPRALVHAQMADLFASPARHVMVFFSDLFGMQQVYNAPGTINEENWSLRAPRNPAATWAARRATGEAWDLPYSLLLALRARGSHENHRHLATRLRAISGPWSEEH